MNGLIGVTGASGFIGEALVKHLSLSGYHGIAISRRRNVSLPHGWRAVDRKLFLSNPENYEVRCIIHLEVKHHVYKESSTSLDEFDEVNVGNTRDYLRAAARCGCKQFIYFSSIF